MNSCLNFITQDVDLEAVASCIGSGLVVIICVAIIGAIISRLGPEI